MSDRRDDRVRACCDRSHDALVAKAEEIFERSATAREHDAIEIRTRRAFDRAHDIVGGALPLDGCFEPHDRDVRCAGTQEPYEIDRPIRRSRRNQTDAKRIRGQIALALGSEEAFGSEGALTLFEDRVQIAETLDIDDADA